jgi:hypothetical protein
MGSAQVAIATLTLEDTSYAVYLPLVVRGSPKGGAAWLGHEGILDPGRMTRPANCGILGAAANHGPMAYAW